jgi:hypothetical protein
MSYFLSYTHYTNIRLTEAIDLAPLTAWFNGNESITQMNYFLAYTLTTSLTEAIDLTPLTGWFNGNESITDLSYFLSFTHYNNSSLTEAIDLTPLAGWFNDNNKITQLSDFLSYTHYNNSSLKLTGQIIFPNWIKKIGGASMLSVSSNFNRTFYFLNSQSGDSGEPQFMDGTVLSSLGTPNTNKQTYTNRTGITPLNTGWK